MINELKKIAKMLIAKNAENEVERLMKSVLKNTPFSNKTFAVGGYVRDQYLGIDAKDLDVVVEMKDGAKRITKFLHDKFPMQTTNPYELGAGYPIWQITFKDDVVYDSEIYETKGAIIEFADTMKESFPDPNTRKRTTEFGTLEEDSMRRDFSVNMMLKDLTTGEFLDLTGVSKSDIERGILRGHPKVSLDKIFSDDPLRMVRITRFYCKYNWNIPMDVIKTVKRNSQRIEIVSSERIIEELKKIMLMGKLHKAIKFMKLSGLLKYVLPEIQELIGVEQPKEFHKEGDVLRHTLKVLQNAPATIEGQLSALLHDVGKSKTQQIIGDKIQFLGHEDVGAEIAEAILRRLKFDSETIKKVTLMVKEHMRPHNLSDASDKALRRFIRDVGNEMVDSILDLAEADAKGSEPIMNDIPKLRERLKNIKESPIPVSKKAVLNGLEIMECLGIKQGKTVGDATKFLLELEDEYASRNELLTKEIACNELKNKFK